MNKTNPKVDGYIRKNKQWQEVLQALRQIILDRPLVEDVKWRTPCYTFEGHNVVFIGAWKEYCVLSFIKGALLKDPKKILIQQTENMQAGRLIRFTSVKEILKMERVLKAYLDEAIAVEKAGLKVQFKKTSEFKMADEFRSKLDENPALKTAFAALTPGRQRGYLLYFSAAKQSTTRAARVDKSTPRILDGKGLDDD